MKNKRSIYTIAIIFTCAILSSCSDWLDVNHNPNSAEKVDPGYLFNYAVVNWAGSRTGGDAYIPLSQVSSVRQTAAMIMGAGRKVIMS